MTICTRCSEDKEKTVMSFGKPICLECRNNRPRKGSGNAGLYSTGQLHLADTKALTLKRVPKSDGLFGKLFFEHYPQSKGIVGRSINYIVMYEGRCIGIIGGASPPKNYRIFNQYFGKGKERHYLNNNVFRLIENIPNIGTQTLRQFRKAIKMDYESKFGDTLLGLCTFVEIPRDGALYKADNWDYLGDTQGKRMFRRGENWGKIFTDGEIKHIFGYKYKIPNKRLELLNTVDEGVHGVSFKD